MSTQSISGSANTGTANNSAETPSVTSMEQTLDLLADATDAALNVGVEVPDVTIIVPVFNEVHTLPIVLDRIDEVMPESTEVIVVDDGSSDGTTAWLTSLEPRTNRIVLCRNRNHGKGAAVRLAIKHSQGRVVAIQDADLEYDPVHLLDAIQPISDGNADVVYGSRYLQGDDDPSIVHRLGNWLLTALSNRLTGQSLTDMETCHKAFRGDLIRSIQLHESRFGFEPEITAKIAARGISIQEIPTQYDSRSYQEGKKIGWRDAVSAIVCMWKYRRG